MCELIASPSSLIPHPLSLTPLMETITINNDKQSLNNVKVGKDVKIFNFVESQLYL